jgi:hypothetical protein
VARVPQREMTEGVRQGFGKLNVITQRYRESMAVGSGELGWQRLQTNLRTLITFWRNAVTEPCTPSLSMSTPLSTIRTVIIGISLVLSST